MPSKRIASAADRRARVLSAARSVFEKDGNLDGGLRKIATTAGYTTGAIYKLFTGKEDIYAALLEESLIEFARVTALAAAKQSDPESALRSASLALVEYYQQHEFEYRLGLYMFERGGKKGLGKERDQKLNALLEEGMAIFQVCFEKLGDSHAKPEKSRDLAHSLFASLVGVLALYFSSRDKSLKTDWQKILDTTLTTFVNEATR